MGALKIDKYTDIEAFKKIESILHDAVKSKSRLNDVMDKLSLHSDEIKIEELECERRDGFIPHSFNKGGWEASFIAYGYTDIINSLELSPEVISRLEDLQSDDYEYALSDTFDEFKPHLKRAGINDVKSFKSYWNKLIAEGVSDYVNDKDTGEAIVSIDEIRSFLHDKESEQEIDQAVMFKFRIMYHGYDNDSGYFSATIDSRINWEAPYFRDGKGASDYKEVEIEFKDESDLKEIIDNSIKEVTSLYGI